LLQKLQSAPQILMAQALLYTLGTDHPAMHHRYLDTTHYGFCVMASPHLC